VSSAVSLPTVLLHNISDTVATVPHGQFACVVANCLFVEAKPVVIIFASTVLCNVASE